MKKIVFIQKKVYNFVSNFGEIRKKDKDGKSKIF